MQQQINTIYTISVILLILAIVFLALFIFLFLHFFIFKKKKNKNVQEHFDIFEEERKKRAKEKEKEDRYGNAAQIPQAYDETVPLKKNMTQTETMPLKNVQTADPYAAGTVPLREYEKPMQGFYGSGKRDIPLDETLPMEEEEEFEGEDFWAENTVMLDTLDEQETQMLAGNKKEEGFEIKEDIVITHGRKH